MGSINQKNREITPEDAEYSVHKFNLGILATRLEALRDTDTDIDDIVA